ncbi:MAG: TolC family protein [Tannerellaceae bacterium]|nr:TolC family protein [Tannerellaceae bacterium]
MKKILLYIPALLLLFSLQSKAQRQAWTLEECINYAIENNITLKQIELEQQDQEVLLNTSRNSWLPNLNANVGQDFNFGRTITEDNTYDNINTASTQAYLSLNMPVFDGFKIQNDIAARKLDLLASIENLNKAKEDLAMNVTSYYVTVLFNKEILHIAELQVLLSQEQVERTEVLVNTGKVPLSQLYDIKAQLADNEVTLAEARNNVSISLLDLVQALELERSGGNFNIIEPSTENVIEKYMGSLLPPDDIFDYAVTFKPQIKAQEYLLEGQKKI